jgi:hypothetical protein
MQQHTASSFERSDRALRMTREEQKAMEVNVCRALLRLTEQGNNARNNADIARALRICTCGLAQITEDDREITACIAALKRLGVAPYAAELEARHTAMLLW